MKIRVVRTASNARAVQVVRYHNNRRVIVRHIGSAPSQTALNERILAVNEWIKDYQGQLSLFPDDQGKPSYRLLNGVLKRTTFIILL